MRRFFAAVSLAFLIALVVPMVVLNQQVDEQLLATYRRLSPAGGTIQFGGRPVDIALTDDGKHLWVKDNTGVRLVDNLSWSVVASAASKGGASLTGLEVVGDSVYFTSAGRELHEFTYEGGEIITRRTIELPPNSFPCGLAIRDDLAYVCLSRLNTVGVVDLKAGELIDQIEVGIAPYDIELVEDGRAFVTNQGGYHAKEGDTTAPSAGTETPVDKRGVAIAGTVSILDINSHRVVKEIYVGLQPSGMAIGTGWVAVANANSDTISFLSGDGQMINQFVVKPDSDLPYGSMPNALAVGADGNTLFAACAGNNAIAIINASNPADPRVKGWVPTGWYPGAVEIKDGLIYVANVKGVGSRTRRRSETQGWNSHDHRGTVSKVHVPLSRTTH